MRPERRLRGQDEQQGDGLSGPPATPLGLAWIDQVNQRERHLGHACCGARTPAGAPCPLKPNHPNGRCKFHGGFDTTGAQPGNRNAVAHGLYSRGLQRCGEHCPMWKHCPIPDEDVAKLSPKNRPNCPYETTQFQMALTDIQHRLDRSNLSDPLDSQLATQTALLQVMVQRAMATLSISPLTEQTKTKRPDNTTTESTRPAAALTAFLRLSAEFRRCLALLPKPDASPSFDEKCATNRRREHDTQLTPEAQQTLERHGATAQDHIEKAEDHVAQMRYWEQWCKERYANPNHDPTCFPS